MSLTNDRQYDFDNWIIEIQREYPDCDVRPTRWGCEVRDESGKLIIDYEYESDPYAEQLVRY